MKEHPAIRCFGGSMMRWRLWGIEFRVSLLFPAALVVMFSLDTSSLPVWCVAASAMHEAGHFIAIYALGQKPLSVSAGIFGVCVVPDPKMPVGYTGSILISLAGPAVNLISFTVIYATAGLNIPAMVHLVLALFNLLPVEPLDGGQALYALLASRFSERASSCALTVISTIVIVPLATAGFYMMLQSGYNFSLLAVSIYLFLLLILKKRKQSFFKH